MASLIQKPAGVAGGQVTTSTNPANTMTTKSTTNQAPRMELSPEAKRTLTTGLMSGVMGATWFATPKISGGNTLIQLDNDKFESVTKKLANLKDSEQKEAFDCIKGLRKTLTEDSSKFVDSVFNGKEKISSLEMLKQFDKNITSVDAFDTHITNLKSTLEKIPAIVPDEKGITAELIDNLGKNNNIDGKYLADFKAKFPIGSTPKAKDCIDFTTEYVKKPLEELRKGEKFKQLLNIADKDGNIAKNTAQKTMKQYIVDCNLDNIKACFETIKDKLPKARLKGAAKWFGIGIALSIASNIIFSSFGKKSAAK